MMNARNRLDAISNRRRAGLKALVGQLLGFSLIALLLVMTIAVLF